MTEQSSQDDGESPEKELSEEEMAARLDEAIDRLSQAGDSEPDGSDEVEIRIEDDEENGEEAPAPVLGDVILSVAERKETAKEEDLDTPDPAAEEEIEAEVRWDPVNDQDEPDLVLEATDQPKTHDDLWEAVPDGEDEDLTLVDVEERAGDPWGPVGEAAPPLDPPVRPTTTVELPPPVARRASDGPLRRTPPSRSLPWRGITSLLEPDLPDLLYIVDVSAERSCLLVAAWAWDEDEPAGSRLRLRLADDGPELLWPASAPHEAAIEARLVLDGKGHRIRLALEVGRDQRGLRLGRDVLAGRFQVDAGTDAWPEEE